MEAWKCSRRRWVVLAIFCVSFIVFSFGAIPTIVAAVSHFTRPIPEVPPSLEENAARQQALVRAMESRFTVSMIGMGIFVCGVMLARRWRKAADSACAVESPLGTQPSDRSGRGDAE